MTIAGIPNEDEIVEKKHKKVICKKVVIFVINVSTITYFVAKTVKMSKIFLF